MARLINRIVLEGLLSFFIILLLILLYYPLALAEETITITSYYPSPYGSYKELRAKRIAIGDNYFDGSAYCWEGTCTNTINANADLVVEGNVGIGTPSPIANLHILSYNGANLLLESPSAGLANTPRISFKNSASASYIGFVGGNAVSGDGNDMMLASNTNLNFFTAGVNRMNITTGGKVGIGTLSPHEKLSVNGSIQFCGNALGSTGKITLSGYTAPTCPAGWVTLAAQGQISLCAKMEAGCP
ncbi:MAG: hypothetical protein ABH882_02105 [Candidatus Omnitrophota bacterium]|nr:hypothetical protein [Candidatus Omnitrophota bacterium]MBU1928561.1 hypothetical protein [Candidatus Omnitrophota bacterium]MBU2034574.1 hypothetical protein [Candidatus Omnitrophota bacterium]MBU2221523.1 hypothetical protein [Candidatus Omnitrophota bacterium]